MDGPASVVFEILSNATRNDDIEKKQPQYLAQGVSEVWLIDPDAQSVRIFWSESEPITITEGWAISKIISGFRIKIEWLWNPNSLSEREAIEEIENFLK